MAVRAKGAARPPAPPAGYRTASAPAPIVTQLHTSSARETPFYVLAGLIAAGAVLAALGHAPFHDVTLIAAVAGLVAIAGRSGRSYANVELNPGSGRLTLVSRGYQATDTREECAVDSIAAIRLDPLEVPIRPSEKLVVPVIVLGDGTVLHVFGRPLGVSLDEGRQIAATLEKQIAAARPLPWPLARVEVEADVAADEAVEAAASREHDRP